MEEKRKEKSREIFWIGGWIKMDEAEILNRIEKKALKGKALQMIKIRQKLKRR